jgi:hypothetical protein
MNCCRGEALRKTHILLYSTSFARIKTTFLKGTLMGRTLPSITRVFLEEEDALGRFRRALRRSDQRALDDLLVSARQHLAAAAYAAHLMPFETFLLCMLLEEHKEVQQLRGELEALRSRLPEKPHGIA